MQMHGDCQFLSRMSIDHARLITPPPVYEKHALVCNAILVVGAYMAEAQGLRWIAV